METPLDEDRLCFADDQIIIAQDYEDMVFITRRLIEWYKKWGKDRKDRIFLCRRNRTRHIIRNKSNNKILQVMKYGH